MADVCGRQGKRREKGTPALSLLSVSAWPPARNIWIPGQRGKSEGVVGVVDRPDCEGRALTGGPPLESFFIVSSTQLTNSPNSQVLTGRRETGREELVGGAVSPPWLLTLRSAAGTPRFFK